MSLCKIKKYIFVVIYLVLSGDKFYNVTCQIFVTLFSIISKQEFAFHSVIKDSLQFTNC